MKSKEELNALKEEIEAMNRKLAELTEEELTQVSGGSDHVIYYDVPEPEVPGLGPRRNLEDYE